jgi:two-component system NtrC family sensor kinase
MTAGIAHEVNNRWKHPAVLGTADEERRILRDKERPEIIHDEAKRAAKIMSELLSFKQGAGYKKRRLNIQKIIKALLERRRYEQSVKNISVYANLPDKPLYVKGSPVEINQALLNVLINAEEALSIRKYGTIIVTARTEQNWLKINIADDGPGIPDNNLGLVFHPFYTTKKVGEGTGLGLSTSYNIISRHDGLIRAENNDMGGATITIELPLAEAPARKIRKKISHSV